MGADAGLARTRAHVDAYYSDKLQRWGATPRGVDWTCAATQALRFVQLMRVCADDGRFSLNDVGCGYGALLSFLAERHPGRTVDYTGIDLSAAMVDAAERLWAGAPNLRFAQGSACPAPADYSVASGIFNVCQSIGRAEWERFVRATLHDMRQASRRAFSVNFMAPLAPGMPDVPELYRTAPQPWIDVCARELGGDVELLEGYGLREFTLLVRL